MIISSGIEVNLVWAVLGFFSVFMIIFGGLINYLETFVPQILSDAFRYGKTSKSTSNSSFLVRAIEVPKHYFTHFYVFASVYVGLIWAMSLGVFVFGVPAPEIFLDFLDFFGTSARRESCSAEGAFIALTLLLVQCFKRLYECAFVNVKSNAKMNLLHYIVGYAHYFCAGTGILLEAPGFQNRHHVVNAFKWLHVELDLRNVSLVQVAASLVFLWAWYHQHVAHKIFADLRRGKKAATYSIPRGDWFEYVSCPHYLAEIVLYVCLSAILGVRHQTGLIVMGWVIINQIVAGLMSHFWYQDKFDNYPRSRKAIIPFLL